MFAPRLLASPDLVVRPGRRALWTPYRWFTQRDIYRIVQLEGLVPLRGRACNRHLPFQSQSLVKSATSRAGQGVHEQHGSVRDAGIGTDSTAARSPPRTTVTPGLPPRYMRGPPEVHARYIGLSAPGYRTDGSAVLRLTRRLGRQCGCPRVATGRDRTPAAIQFRRLSQGAARHVSAVGTVDVKQDLPTGC
jgi:hypothetical protein